MNLPTADDVHAAQSRIAAHIVRTPMLRSPLLDSETGGTILVKAEPLQRTGSFKLRGATQCPAAAFFPNERARGVVTYSSGNHGQAISCAAASLGMQATSSCPPTHRPSSATPPPAGAPRSSATTERRRTGRQSAERWSSGAVRC